MNTSFEYTRGVVNLAELKHDRVIVYCYPRTGEPGKAYADDWDAISGARGCTPQSCSMRENYHAITNENAEAFGLTTQTTEYQNEAATRLHLPFALLADEHLRLSRALRLPTFQVNGWTLTNAVRLSCIAKGSRKSSIPCFLQISTVSTSSPGCEPNGKA